jgi:hypothetical protein
MVGAIAAVHAIQALCFSLERVLHDTGVTLVDAGTRLTGVGRAGVAVIIVSARWQSAAGERERQQGQATGRQAET